MSPNDHRPGRLWPYGFPAALLAIPVVWLLLILILRVTERLTGWPPPRTRPLVLYVTLVVSLVPIALRLLDLARDRWEGVQDRQSSALAEIRFNRAVFEDMVARTRAEATPPPGATATGGASAAGAATTGPPSPPGAAAGAAAVAAWVESVLKKFDELKTDAQATTDQHTLEGLTDEAKLLVRQRAFLCPEKHIQTEAKARLAALAEWGLPAKTIDSLREIAGPALSVKDVDEARAALHMILEEYGTWSPYIDEYNANTSFWASTALTLIAVMATSALFMMFGWSWKILALVCAAVAGASASVIARLPGLTNYGEWKVNLRAYQARIGTGIVGSLVGIGLLGSGLITITLPGQWKSADLLLDACLSVPSTTSASSSVAPTTTPPQTPGAEASTEAAVPCKGGGLLFLLALTMLLGFSERLLTTLEGRVAGANASDRPKS